MAFTQKPPLLSALLFISAVALWPFIEWHAVLTFDHGKPGYDMLVESLSDLGVNYRNLHVLKHHNVMSHRHKLMNQTFAACGVLFALGQLYLLWSSRKQATQQTALLRTLRFLLSLTYMGGLILFARIHGGPREKFWQIQGWHYVGQAMVAVGGGLVAIIAGIAPTVAAYERNLAYRFWSIILGVVGLYSLYRFHTLGEWDHVTKIGLWQRGIMYPPLVWQFMTTLAILGQNAFGGASKPKRA